MPSLNFPAYLVQQIQRGAGGGLKGAKGTGATRVEIVQQADRHLSVVSVSSLNSFSILVYNDQITSEAHRILSDYNQFYRVSPFALSTSSNADTH